MNHLNFKSVLFTLGLSIFILSACSKAIKDPENPTVSLSITNGNKFIIGDTIIFSLEANDNDGLHEINLDIYASSDLETSLNNFTTHSHGKTFNEEYEWKAESSLISNYTAILTASDHTLNTGRDTIEFSVDL